MTKEDTLSGIGLGKNVGEVVIGLTDQQKAETREIVVNAIREYWTEDEIKRVAITQAEGRVNDILENAVSAKVAALVENNPQAVMDQLFRQSGMVVRTKSSEYFDGIVGAMLQDEESGIPEAIREHVRDNLTELIQNAISGIVAGMVANYMQDNADALANASKQMIDRAFQNASIRAC